MKFLADMGISLRTVEWLRELGHDVFHLRDRGLQKLVEDNRYEIAHLNAIANWMEILATYCMTTQSVF